MAGLKIKLRPDEEILINGSVIKNGKHQTEITVMTPETDILRLKDAILFEDATTPVKYLCYLSQLIVCGEIEPIDINEELTIGIKNLKSFFGDREAQLAIESILVYAEQENYYKVMQGLRKMVPIEESLFKKSEHALHELNKDMSAVSIFKNLQKTIAEHAKQFDIPSFLRKKA